MNNNNQIERVSDEELDQMIWKLERDGVTPKQLSLMRELREVRRAKGEPVAWIVHARTGDQLTTDSGYVANAEGILGLHSTPLYTAQPAPVVPDVIATDDIPYSVGRFRTHRDCYRDGWNACIAAMQSDGTLTNEDTMQLSGNSEQLEPVSNRDELMPGIKPAPELDSVAKNAESLPGNSPATPDGWVMVPVEPTPEMQSAAAGAIRFDTTAINKLWTGNAVYRAMLAAAPKEVG